ncbi:DUF4878 domain-containing protein [Pseudomonas sp. C27(2019)]|uniref:DUF4878 domain-containing protein n=1 Tax=Pseudomonas sp. C27(2019) TaxID=2604941 RepID=UPI0015B4883C|nr:DUF4878 domain-containing protein [Pseudomonas sp. C27(2019)]
MQILRNGIFMLLTAALLIACSPSNSPEKVAQTYINAVLANDIEGLMATLDIPADTPDEQDTLVRGKLSIMLAETSTRAISFGGVKDVTYSELEYNDAKTRATLVATIRYKQDNAPVKRENITLAKTADGWKVSL